jgi:DNA repair photolyase
MIAISEVEAGSPVTKTRIPAGDYVINPYVGCPHRCLYCYAEYMKRFTNHREPWGDFLDVKRFRRGINVKSLAGKKVVLCSVTDPYNPFEKKFGATREVLEQLVGSEAAVEILTKSDLVLRDLDLFKRLPRVRIGLSLITLDDGICRKLEGGAPGAGRRLAALRRLNGEGIDTYLFLSPFFPGITDFRAILNECKDYTRMFYFENLNLRGAFRPRVLQYIRENHPDLEELYDTIYRRGDRGYWEGVEEDIDAFCRENGIKYGSYFYHEKIRKR